MFLFTFLLYHILSSLSRGFFNFFLESWEGEERGGRWGGLLSLSLYFHYTTSWAFCQGFFESFFCFVVGIIRHYFSETALVHICIPQTYTPCGRCLCRVTSYIALVGFGSSVASLTFCTFIIPHSEGFVKRFFQLFEVFFLTLGEVPSSFGIFIIADVGWIVKTFFEIFQKTFFNLVRTLTPLHTRQGFVASFISHFPTALIVYHILR